MKLTLETHRSFEWAFVIGMDEDGIVLVFWKWQVELQWG